MSDCTHLWTHRRSLGGTLLERCWHCSRVRMPRLTPAEALANATRAASILFKNVYGGSIADLLPRTPSAFLSRLDWGHTSIGAPLQTPRTITTRNGAITHVDGVKLSWVADE